MLIGIRGPHIPSPRPHQLRIVRFSGGRSNVVDRCSTPTLEICWTRQPSRAVEPPRNCPVEFPFGGSLDAAAQPEQMCDERLRRSPVLLGMLHRVRIHEEIVHGCSAGFLPCLRDKFIEHGLARRPASDCCTA